MNAGIEKYLKAYNALQLCGWTLALGLLIGSKQSVLVCIMIFQLLSLAEVFHAWKKWNASNPMHSFLQITARLIILSLLFWIGCTPCTLYYPLPFSQTPFYIMFAVWCMAEITRYSYYLSELLHKQYYTLTWLRYSVFIACYPVGLLCELYIIQLVYKNCDILLGKIVLLLLVVAYAIAFPMLYLHLLKQRKKKL